MANEEEVNAVPAALRTGSTGSRIVDLQRWYSRAEIQVGKNRLRRLAHYFETKNVTLEEAAYQKLNGRLGGP